MFELFKKMYWAMPLCDDLKIKFYYFIRSLVYGSQKTERTQDIAWDFVDSYIKLQRLDNEFSVNYPVEGSYLRDKDDPKIIAFYLPQYYPDDHNNKWWGRGSTEWTNTTKSMPQYIGQYQPRLPGELGFYDLRIIDNIKRQVELAKIYGIYGFCFYFYWFDGERVLDVPLDNFVNNINFPFSLCWANESWTKQWSGSSNEVLIKQSETEESYINFIKSCIKYFENDNYIKIKDRYLLTIYKPDRIPNVRRVLRLWRDYVKNKTNRDLYLVASISDRKQYFNDYESLGWDAISEFAPGPYLSAMKNITQEKKYVCTEFQGVVYDYKEFVENHKFSFIANKKIYRAVCPMWDNTPRRANRAMVLDGSTPELFSRWLSEVIVETEHNTVLDDKIIFVNAWNEWAEGAYLEPDLKFRYQYLEAISNAILEARAIMKK